MSLPPGFIAVHGNHPEQLRQAVVEFSRRQPLAPLESEVIIVQSNGAAQWLRLEMAKNRHRGGLGVAAGVDFQLPLAFVWQIYRAFLGHDQVPAQSPYDKGPLTWRLYRQLPHWVENNDAYVPLSRFLQGGEDDRRRYQLAEKLADLYDQYQVYRADWLSQWETGALDYSGKPLDSEQRWQAALWQQICLDIGQASSRAHIHQRFLAQLKNGPVNPESIPQRVVLFGLSTVPQQTLEVLHALSEHCQVFCYVNNPSQYHWADIFSDREAFKQARKRGISHPVFSQDQPPELRVESANPLLAAWGRQGRDFMRLLDHFDDPSTYAGVLPQDAGRVDLFEPYGQDETLLHQIQNDIFELRPLTEIPQRVRAESDFSVVVHSVHSRQREVEVLHDQLLAAFEADPTLQPADVMVMVPDINQYAAHIQAAFERYPVGDPRRIPYSITDQGQRKQVPMLVALDALLTVHRARMGVSQVLGLLEVEGLCRRFELQPDEVELLRVWFADAQIHWGLDDDHRAGLGLAGRQGTWLEGLERMLLGYAMGDVDCWQDKAPFAPVAGLAAEAVGKLYRLIQALIQLSRRLAGEHQPAHWVDCVQQMLRDFFDIDEASNEQRLMMRLQTNLERWQGALELAQAGDQAMPIERVSEALMQGLDEVGLGQRFMAGKVTFATLMPMRAIPFRHICLLGLNDGEYPRSKPPADFDLMALAPRPGDRSGRVDDLYLFLEALLSARTRLYLSWVGRSVVDNTERPPSVLLSQLADYIDRVWGAGTYEGLIQQHPMQPFSAQYFECEDPQAVNPWVRTFDDRWMKRSDIASQVKSSTNEDKEINFNGLINFFKSPSKYFYRDRLATFFPDKPAEGDDEEVFALDPLANWALKGDLIQASIQSPEQLTRTAQQVGASGKVGQQAQQKLLLDPLLTVAQEFADKYRGLVEPWTRVDDLDLHWVANGGTLDAQLTYCYADENGQLQRVVVVHSEFSNASLDKLAEVWLQHLIAQSSGIPITSHVVNKNQGAKRLFPMSPESAQQCLSDWIELAQQGLQAPQPWTGRSAFAWCNAKPGEAWSKAEAAYWQQYETDNGALRAAFGSALPWKDSDLTELEGVFERLYRPLHQAYNPPKKAKGEK